MIDPKPLGDRGFLARFLDEADARDWDAAARSALQDYGRGVEVVLAFRCVAVHADPELVDLDLLEERLRSIDPVSGSGMTSATGRLVAIPTLYDGADLDESADWLGLSVSELIDRHISAEYRVRAVGFLPGFPYAGPLPGPLVGLPRRSSPRTKVPAGSVAIVGDQTGIYPRDSPGGWRLIGRTPLRIVEMAREHFPIRAGDRLRFLPIGPAGFRALEGKILESAHQDE